MSSPRGRRRHVAAYTVVCTSILYSALRSAVDRCTAPFIGYTAPLQRRSGIGLIPGDEIVGHGPVRRAARFAGALGPYARSRAAAAGRGTRRGRAARFAVVCGAVACAVGRVAPGGRGSVRLSRAGRRRSAATAGPAWPVSLWRRPRRGALPLTPARAPGAGASPWPVSGPRAPGGVDRVVGATVTESWSLGRDVTHHIGHAHTSGSALRTHSDSRHSVETRPAHTFDEPSRQWATHGRTAQNGPSGRRPATRAASASRPRRPATRARFFHYSCVCMRWRDRKIYQVHRFPAP